jgi:hypothetical protein
MLPQQAAVFGAKLRPATGERDEARVEAIDFGLADQFAFSTAGVGADEGGDVGEFQNVEVTCRQYLRLGGPDVNAQHWAKSHRAAAAKESTR